jgi:transcriptional regulator with XRE-family HTH domain
VIMEEDLARWAELLATSLQVSGLSEEDLERRLGWSPGSLGQLLDGKSSLEPDQVLEILGELNEGSRPRRGRGGARTGKPRDGEDFEDDRSQVVTDLLERYRLLGYEPRQAIPPPPAEPSSIEDLEKKVEAILRRAYGERFLKEPLDRED